MPSSRKPTSAHPQTTTRQAPRPRKRPHDATGHGTKNSISHRLRRTVRSFLKNETSAGFLLIGVALSALLIANSPLNDAYQRLSHYTIGPDTIGPIPLGMHLDLHHWAADGILTLFFFIVGLELKTEFVTGALRDIREAALPMIAAAFGLLVPALLYVTIQYLSGAGAYNGWAIPAATDIAFAVALLGVFGRGMPPAARTFLLTLAVVDDLLAILIIALFYSTSINLWALAGSLLTIAVFAVLVQRRITTWYILIPIALTAWALMFNSGVHATIAGVALGLVVPATRDNHGHQMTHHMVEKLGPWSAGLALPIFAFFSAGVSVAGSESGLIGALTNPITYAIALALPAGKLIGITGAVAFLIRHTKLRLGNGIDLPDVAAISLLAGIGFTVAMLVSQLAFTDPGNLFHASFGVILGSFLAALLGAIALKRRVRQISRRG